MGNLTQEDFQRAKRISREIQLYLEETNSNGLRSTDVYSRLARKNLIEKDRHNGYHFRAFLRHLKDNDALNLIPQCKFQYNVNNPEFIEWYFYSIRQDAVPIRSSPVTDRDIPLRAPKLTDGEIDELIEKSRSFVEKLPKRKAGSFLPHEIETRKSYPRAYETWTSDEYQLMHSAYSQFRKTGKVAELLKRQPHIVKEKLKDSGLYSDL
ncbi:MAG: hypothetical protein LBQ74_19890 [Prevotella sp.]|jgi:hypothetical protein|nr:hypothetical protein [Prevotella sp.]